VDIQLELLKARLLERKLGLVLTDAAKRAIALAGYDPVYGARPLKRAIQRMITDPLAQQLLSGQFREGETIVADANVEGVLRFEKQ